LGGVDGRFGPVDDVFEATDFGSELFGFLGELMGNDGVHLSIVHGCFLGDSFCSCGAGSLCMELLPVSPLLLPMVWCTGCPFSATRYTLSLAYHPMEAFEANIIHGEL
jgi:hypothetical protein